MIVDTLTGEYKMLRSDILHDVGASLNPAIDIGQVEGGFVQGLGWLTMEELVWNDKGKLMTNGPASYKIPAVADMPLDLRVKLVENRKNPEDTVFLQAVGEPPFMLGISVWCAIRMQWRAWPTTGRSRRSMLRRPRARALGRGTDAQVEAGGEQVCDNGDHPA